MKVIIVGLGQSGMMLASQLALEQHDVVVIDSCKESVERITDKLNVNGICGSGASRETLIQAGAQTADVILALTPVDETNLLCCMIAKKCGTRFAAARMHREDFNADQKYYAHDFNIDQIISSEYETAHEIFRHIGLPGAVKADAFFSAQSTFIELHIDSNSMLIDMPLYQVKQFFETDMLVGTILRNEKIIIPDGSFVIKENDTIGIVASIESVSQIFRKLGIMRKPVKKVMMVGCGTIGGYLVQMLLKNKIQVKILEFDQQRCLELAQQYPDVEIAYGDGINTDTLLEEGIAQTDVCVSMTGKDETNLVISMFAWSCNVKSIITKITNSSYEKLLHRVSIDITISPSVIIVDRLMQFIRNTKSSSATNSIQHLYRINDGKAEALEFVACETDSHLLEPFSSKNFVLKKEILIAAIIRDKKVLIPGGDSHIEPGDHVVVITNHNNKLSSLEEIYKK